MSLPVDRDLRRAEVAQTAYEIVAKRGLDMLTVRAVAQAKGCSTAVVSHYFTNKRDLLVAVYRLAAERTFAAWADAEAHGGDLFACLKAALPLDPDMQRHWRVHFSFWSAAALDPVLGEIQNGVLAQAGENVLRLLGRDPVGAALALPMQERLSRQILSLQMGIATQASFGHGHWPPDRQASDLRDALGRLLHG